MNWPVHCLPFHVMHPSTSLAAAPTVSGEGCQPPLIAWKTSATLSWVRYDYWLNQETHRSWLMYKSPLSAGKPSYSSKESRNILNQLTFWNIDQPNQHKKQATIPSACKSFMQRTWSFAEVPRGKIWLSSGAKNLKIASSPEVGFTSTILWVAEEVVSPIRAFLAKRPASKSPSSRGMA